LKGIEVLVVVHLLKITPNKNYFKFENARKAKK